MYSLLTDIEESLNKRPLTYVGSDRMNLNPPHLAFGRPLRSFPVIEAIQENISALESDINISRCYSLISGRDGHQSTDHYSSLRENYGLLKKQYQRLLTSV